MGPQSGNIMLICMLNYVQILNAMREKAWKLTIEENFRICLVGTTNNNGKPCINASRHNVHGATTPADTSSTEQQRQPTQGPVCNTCWQTQRPMYKMLILYTVWKVNSSNWRCQNFLSTITDMFVIDHRENVSLITHKIVVIKQGLCDLSQTFLLL